jgi:regulator of CtrA degradation
MRSSLRPAWRTSEGPAVFAATAFFERTYDEAWVLLRETRDYLAYSERRVLKGLQAMDRLRFARESTRLTARLTDIMAWLLAQKAVAAGELAPHELASARHRLLRSEACLDDRGRREGVLPRGLDGLMERSHRLYLRISRLDELLARDILP